MFLAFCLTNDDLHKLTPEIFQFIQSALKLFYTESVYI
jgi:hypothetical protein